MYLCKVIKKQPVDTKEDYTRTITKRRPIYIHNICIYVFQVTKKQPVDTKEATLLQRSNPNNNRKRGMVIYIYIYRYIYIPTPSSYMVNIHHE